MSQAPPPPSGDPGAVPFASPAPHTPPTGEAPAPPPAAPSPGYDAPPTPPPAFAPADQRVPTPPPRRHVRWWLAGVGLLLLAGLAVLLVVLTRSGADARPEEILVPTSVRIDQIQVGDCLEPMPAAGSVDQVTLVGCAQFHTGQIVDEVTVSEADNYPGAGVLRQSATELCRPAWKEATARVQQLANTTVQAGTTVIYPSLDSWKAGDRSGWCVVYGVDGSFAGSLLNP